MTDFIACPTSIDRRRFLQKATLLAAASAFGSVLPGCADYVVELPCLGPALPPVPVPGMTYIRASDIGCALDCDLTSGRNKHTGGAATDDGPRINAAMAGASESNPITLILDGSALISGLFLPAGGYWSIAGLGCGTGFFIKTGTNNDGIHNGSNRVVTNAPGPPAPATRGKNVSLSNFALNGNRGNGKDGDSTGGSRRGSNIAWFFGINLINLDNITIENVVVVNSPTYQMRFSNVGNVSISGCALQGIGVNTDGIHCDGPANDINISNCSFTTGDDSIALNCPEGYSGNISRVTVTNCTFNSWSLMRLYTTLGSDQFTIDTVKVSNCTGTFQQAAFFIGLFFRSIADAVTGLNISDCTLTAPTVLAVSESFGTISLSNVTFVPAKVDYDKSEPNHVPAFLRPPPPYAGVNFVGSSLSFQKCAISRRSNMDVAGVILQNDSAISHLAFDGFALQDGHSAIAELLNLEAGTIGQLVIDSLDSRKIRTLVGSGGISNVDTVSGAGVLATGWAFPDAVMCDGVPYLSMSTGEPAIKIGGVVEPYPRP
jgi:hypothetical protein